MWTQFWDMHSGGGQKEKWAKIYIESDSEEQAIIIFYNRFGHNPNRVTCTCCGEDYGISSNKNLKQLTGFHRGCRSIYKKVGGKYTNEKYIENNEKVPRGYEISIAFGTYQTLAQYIKNKDVLFIKKKDVKKDEKYGEVPRQGYCWIE